MYSGEYKNGKCHGKGKYMTPFQTYDGEWENHKKHGFGTEMYIAGDLENQEYEGYFDNG